MSGRFSNYTGLQFFFFGTAHFTPFKIFQLFAYFKPFNNIKNLINSFFRTSPGVIIYLIIFIGVILPFPILTLHLIFQNEYENMLDYAISYESFFYELVPIHYSENLSKLRNAMTLETQTYTDFLTQQICLYIFGGFPAVPIMISFGIVSYLVGKALHWEGLNRRTQQKKRAKELREEIREQLN